MDKASQEIDINLWEYFLDRTAEIDTDVADVVVGVLLIVIFVVSVLGNSVTCAVIYQEKTMHTATNYYLFNLAVSDLIVTFAIPIELYYNFYSWPRPQTLSSTECIVHNFFVELLWNNSILIMTALAIERFIAIWYPLLLNSKSAWRRILKIILFLWIVAVVEALAEVMFVQLVSMKNVNICFTVPTKRARIINGVLAMSTFLLPTAIMLTLYLLIIFKVKRNHSLKRDTIFNYPDHSSRVTRLIVAITLSFLICWMPFFLIRLFTFALDLRQLARLENYWSVLYNVTMVNGWISTAINPILFSLMSTKFRTALREWKTSFRNKSSCGGTTNKLTKRQLSSGDRIHLTLLDLSRSTPSPIQTPV